MKPLYAVINSGDIASAALDVRQVRGIRAIHVPAVTSGDLLLLGALDAASASFARLLDTRVASGDLRFVTGAGSRFIPFPESLAETLPPYLRLEIATAPGSLQADVRTLTILTR